MPVNLLAIYAANVKAPGGRARFSALILEDPGSTYNLITHKLAESLLLPSQLTVLSLTVPGHQRDEQYTHTYIVTLTDQHGARPTVQAIGVDNITVVEPAPEVEHDQLVKLFPGTEQEKVHSFIRPHGRVQLMLGMEMCFLHSRDGRKANNLRLNKTVFYLAWVLRKAAQNKQRAQVLEARTIVLKGKEEADGLCNSDISDSRSTPRSK